MIENLEGIDRLIVLTINGWHTPFLDELMWWISARITWFPLYALLIYLAYKKFTRSQFFLFLGLAILCVALADLISVYLFKEVFLRYRPSHHAWLTNRLHFYEIKPGEFYKGGQYGFVSSHAANFFAIATFVGLALKKFYPKLIWILFGLGVLICFSRIYLGVHYFSDVVVGGMVGGFTAMLIYRYIYCKNLSKIS